MANESRVFKALRKNNDWSFTEVDLTDTSIDDYPMLINAGRWTGSAEMYRHETSMMEKITKVRREDTEDAKKRFKVAHTKSKYVKKDVVKKMFNYTPYSYDEEEVFAEFQMEYTSSDKISNALSTNHSHFNQDETITITTETSGDITCNLSDLQFVYSYGSNFSPYKLKLNLNKNLLDILMYNRSFSCDSSLKCEEKLQMFRCNLDTGLIYYANDESTPLSDMTNATTGHAGEQVFDFLTEDIVDTMLNMVKSYVDDKYGVETTAYKMSKNLDTVKGYIFNPLCSVMYLYKPFFNTRFRTYFKRDDVSTNHFETLCNMLGLPFDEKLVFLAAKHHKNIFLAKCIHDAGINNIDNIISIIEAAISCDWLKYPIRLFIDKYYGDQTDYLLHNSPYQEEYRLALCTYIKKALSYVDEDAFTEMFVRSTAQHSKYWKRSLLQVATLIELEDYSRELMRKACSYGLNKIQSDAIDLAYDKAITKNKFIRYSTAEMALEEATGSFYFKRPIDMSEISDLLRDIGYEEKKLPMLAARKIYNTMFVKDDRGETLACLVTRNNDLVDVYITKRSLRHSKEDINELCLNYVKKHQIRQYFCDKLKNSKKSTTFLPF